MINNVSNPFSILMDMLAQLGSGSFWSGILIFFLITFLVFNIPTLISVVRLKGFVFITEMLGKSIINMGLAMTPFTFILGYMGLWEALKESVDLAD